MKDFVAIDIETSGLDAERDYIIKVMATKVKAGEVIDKFSSLVFCPEKLSPEVIKLTGISDADLGHTPTLDVVMEQFEHFREGLPLVAYNAPFIEKFLRRYHQPLIDIADISKLAQSVLGDNTQNYHFKQLAERFKLSDAGDDEAEMVANIYLKLYHTLIPNILEWYNEQTNWSFRQAPTFLEVLGRSYDEDLISRILAYILLTDNNLFGKIVGFYFNSDAVPCEVLSVECEKSMCGGRADIFAVAKDSTGNRYTLTIENKIRSWEHDEQTETYFKFVTNQNEYRNFRNVFIYLKPDFNGSEPSCASTKTIKRFESMTYGKLLTLIDGMEDKPIIADFKSHIKKCLKDNEVKIMDTDAMVFQNYKMLKEIMSNAEEKFKAFKQQFVGELFKNNIIPGLNYNPYNKNDNKPWKEYLDDEFVVEVSYDCCFRIYKNKKWWHEDENSAKQYYFYVELMFCDNAPNEIVVQQVAKRYGSKAQDSVVYKFVNDSLIPDPQHSGQWFGQYYVIRREKFPADEYEVLSSEWQKVLKEFAKKTLTAYIDEMEKTFFAFDEYLKTFTER